MVTDKSLTCCDPAADLARANITRLYLTGDMAAQLKNKSTKRANLSPPHN